MSIGLYSHNTRATGTVLTATIYNGDHVNHITNQNPLQTGAYSDTVPQMQIMTNPGSVGSESLAPHLAGELERLRFKINDLALYLGLTAAQWYSTFTGTVSASKVSPPAIATISGNTTLTVADVNTIKNITAAADITLPAVSALVTGNAIKFKSSTEQKVRLLIQGSDLIDGDVEYLIPSYTTCEVMVSGANSFILTLKPDYQVGLLYPCMVAGSVAPRGFLFPDGAARSRATYGGLFYASSLTGLVTMTIASPCVVTWTSNKLQNNDSIEFSTTGALPTGIVAGTTYYVTGLSGATFNVAATPGGAAINTSGTQSGVHTGLHVPYGRGDGATTFNVADIRGGSPHARDALGGTAANRITFAVSAINADTPGVLGGSQSHILTTAELPASGLSIPSLSVSGNILTAAGGNGLSTTRVTPADSGNTSPNSQPLSGGSTGTGTTGNMGSGGAHTVMNPIQVTSWLVKT